MPNHNAGQVYEQLIRDILSDRNILPNDLQGNDAGFRKIETHLVAKETARAGAGAVTLVDAAFEDGIQELQVLLQDGFILLHTAPVTWGASAWARRSAACIQAWKSAEARAVATTSPSISP